MPTRKNGQKSSCGATSTRIPVARHERFQQQRLLDDERRRDRVTDRRRDRDDARPAPRAAPDGVDRRRWCCPRPHPATLGPGRGEDLAWPAWSSPSAPRACGLAGLQLALVAPSSRRSDVVADVAERRCRSAPPHAPRRRPHARTVAEARKRGVATADYECLIDDLNATARALDDQLVLASKLPFRQRHKTLLGLRYRIADMERTGERIEQDGDRVGAARSSTASTTR